MIWTDEKPELTGYYWVRKNGDDLTRIITTIYTQDIEKDTVLYLGHWLPMVYFEFARIPTPSEPIDNQDVAE